MRHVLFLILLYCFSKNYAQNISMNQQRNENTLRICFYNLENFFDYDDNPAKDDDAFTPTGVNNWTKTKFENKAKKIAKVFVALGQWDLPEIIGVCEVENETVIHHLLYKTPLSSGKYKYVYYESPDSRGLNVALFYRPEKFKVITSHSIRLIDSLDISYKTRDILYVQGVLISDCKDTLHLFINHWSSRYGGYAATVSKRNLAALTLRLKIDSLLNLNPDARILIMGDFNDYPDDESLTLYLHAPYDTNDRKENNLINMMYPYFSKNNMGTHKYQQYWGILDQIIVSPGLYRAQSGLQTKTAGIIFNSDFLLEEDKVNIGEKPMRTYLGPIYQGGYSDHLPIYIDLWCN